MKQADYQARLDAAVTSEQRLTVIAEQLADINALSQEKVLHALDGVVKEIGLIRAQFDQFRIEQSNLINGTVGNVDLKLEVLKRRFDAYEILGVSLATTLANQVTERIRASDLLQTELNAIAASVETLKHDE